MLVILNGNVERVGKLVAQGRMRSIELAIRKRCRKGGCSVGELGQPLFVRFYALRPKAEHALGVRAQVGEFLKCADDVVEAGMVVAEFMGDLVE